MISNRRIFSGSSAFLVGKIIYSLTSYDLYELGMQEMQDGNYKNALTYFNSGLELEKVPNKQNLMKSAIAAYEYSGDFDSAKKMMKEYLKAYPDDEEAKHENTFLETR